MANLPVLSVLLLLPLFGAAAIFLFVRENEGELGARNAKYTALFVTLITFIASIALILPGFDSSSAAFQYVEKHEWVADGVSYHLGIDGISFSLILLTTFLMPICILSSWRGVKERVREFMIAFLVLESFIIGVFCALDAVLFYIFFEGMLIPMFLIIGIWGGNNRVYASYKFFLYTLLGSVLFLLAILWLYYTYGTTSIPELMELSPQTGLDVQKLLWLAMFASFAVKVPMWPVHTWLPDAHVQAPTAGSVILAGILLKMGGYGFLRFSLPMLPEASHFFTPMVWSLSVIAVIVTSLIALVQDDMKKLIAYSSVAHMGFVTAGLFAFNQQAIEGAMIQMISHGLISGALFICVGVVYDRVHSRDIARYGGVAKVMPWYAVAFLFFTMASVGLPGTSGFTGEFMVLLGSYQASSWLAFGLATGLILGAAYALLLYRRVSFGELVRNELKKLKDLELREFGMFAVLAVMVLWLGIYPEPLLEMLHAPVENLLEQVALPQATDAAELASLNEVSK
jgi:NADH-quinone oxidoreductase subunit M